MKEFILKKRSTNTFTLDVYEQQSKNLDELESLVEGTEEELKKVLKNKNPRNFRSEGSNFV